MRDIRIEKIVLNVGCGTTLNIENARKILEKISQRKAVITKTKKRSTFGVPKAKEIGCKVTIRKNTEALLKKLLEAKENKLKEKNFDDTGNFSFGVAEYIDVPGVDYEPKIGILGFDVCVTLERPGYRVKKKRIAGKLGRNHRIKKDEAMKFVKSKFKVEIGDK